MYFSSPLPIAFSFHKLVWACLMIEFYPHLAEAMGFRGWCESECVRLIGTKGTFFLLVEERACECESYEACRFMVCTMFSVFDIYGISSHWSVILLAECLMCMTKYLRNLRFFFMNFVINIGYVS